MHRSIRLWLLGLLGVVAVTAIAWFGYEEYQKYLGRQAIAGITLENLPLPVAIERAKVDSRPVLVEVFALWCPTCRVLHNQVLADPAVSSFIRENFVFSMLDFDAPGTNAFLEERAARGTPSLWIMDPSSSEFVPLPVTLDPGEFLVRLRRHTES